MFPFTITSIIEISLIFLKIFQNNAVYFSLETHCLFIQVTSGLIVAENLLSFSSFSCSFSFKIQQQLQKKLCYIAHYLTCQALEKGNDSLLSKRPIWNLPSLILVSKPKKLAILMFVSISFT